LYIFKKNLTIQVRLAILFVTTFGLLLLLGGVLFWQINASVESSKNLIEQNSRIFLEINELVKRSNEAQEIFDEILLFDSDSDEELFDLQVRFNAAAVDFDIMLNVLSLGSESEDFIHHNDGVDYFVWRNFISKPRGQENFILNSGPSVEKTFSLDQYNAIEKKYNEFVYNVNEATAAQKKFLRLSREYVQTFDLENAIGPSLEVEQGQLTSQEETRASQAEISQGAARIFGQRANRAGEAIVAMLSIASNDLRDTLLERIISESQKQEQLYNQGAFVLVSGTLLLMIMLSLVVHYLAVRPLQRLTDSAKKIVEGHKDMVFPLQDRGDEIGLLARTFSSMVEALVRDAETLEVQVLARTKQLDNKNVQLEKYINEIDKTTKSLMRREVELTQANSRLTQASKAKSEFVSVAAHQLRTPLTAIRWIYETLSQAKDISPAHQEVIRNGVQATDNLIITVNDILNVARIDEGHMTYAKQEHDFRELLDGILTETEFDAKHKGITFRFHIQKEASFVFMFDWEKMDMVVRNLLSNSMKYTEVGGIVQLYISQKNHDLVMVVADNGIGIPLAQQPRIFTKFFRADNALLYQTNGSGLGLYVTRNIVEKHNGTIDLESREGEGAMFTVRIPMHSQKV